MTRLIISCAVVALAALVESTDRMDVKDLPESVFPMMFGYLKKFSKILPKDVGGIIYAGEVTKYLGKALPLGSSVYLTGFTDGKMNVYFTIFDVDFSGDIAYHDTPQKMPPLVASIPEGVVEGLIKKYGKVPDYFKRAMDYEVTTYKLLKAGKMEELRKFVRSDVDWYFKHVINNPNPALGDLLRSPLQ